jgi:hypothetical protein
MLHLHTVGLELILNCFPDDVIHISGFGGEAVNVALLDVVPQVDTVLWRG